MNVRTDIQRRWLLIAAGALLGLLVADRLILSPLLAHWKEQGSQIANLRQSVDQGTTLLEREQAMRQRWQQMTREAMPPDASAAENSVLKAAARWARESRITFTSLVPQWQTREEGYKTLECRATAHGDLQAVTRFLYELERDPLPLRLRSVEITGKDERGRELNLDARFSALSLASAPKATP